MGFSLSSALHQTKNGASNRGRRLFLESLEHRTLLAANGILGEASEVIAPRISESETASPDYIDYFRGDANRDGIFDQLDLVAVLQAGKYGTGEAATWSEGDWNTDGIFDESDLALALQTGCYLNDICDSSKPLLFDATDGDNGHPAAKASAQVSNFHFAESEFETVLGQTIKTPNNKDLLIDVAVVSKLVTDTTVKTKGGVRDTETAEAGVEIQVLVDGEVVFPGTVVFAQRKQELSATLQGIIDGCEVIEGVLEINNDCLTEEEIQLLLESMSANSFNFVKGDLSPGVHYVEVQARVSTAVSSVDANAEAWVGPGSVTIEVVRMIKNEDIIVDVG